MDGDSPDLAKLKTICEQNQAWFMLDDAHGVGVQGEQGRGTFAAQGIELSESDILVTTFGKAVGAQGAAVLAHKDTIDYLTNFSREYIYSTHLSPLQAEAVRHNISVLRQEDWRQAKLQQNIALFRELASGLPFDLLASHSPIQPILIGEEDKAVAIAQKLKEKGIWVGAMRYPTVAKDQARLRVTITTNHDEQDIRLLVEELARLGDTLNA